MFLLSVLSFGFPPCRVPPQRIALAAKVRCVKVPKDEQQQQQTRKNIIVYSFLLQHLSISILRFPSGPGGKVTYTQRRKSDFSLVPAQTAFKLKAFGDGTRAHSLCFFLEMILSFLPGFLPVLRPFLKNLRQKVELFSCLFSCFAIFSFFPYFLINLLLAGGRNIASLGI